MTAREWVPGDVALVEAGCWANRKVALRLAEGWAHTNGVNVDGDGVIDTVRSLVVVDPEDAEQVARITQAILDAIPLVAADIPMKEGRAAYWYEALPLAVDAALRNLIEPPRPPEPMGLGAVVEDDHGQRWLAVGASGGGEFRWARDGLVTGKWHVYAEINVVHVLSEGVTA